jgi:cation-transporting P-type ATPase E
MTETTAPTVLVPDSVTGLTHSEVEARVKAGETNAVVEVTSRPLSEIVRANVFTRFNGLLGALLVLVLLTGSYKHALFGIALVVNSVLGIGQEWHAKRKLDSLAVLHSPTAIVLRDGVCTEVPSAGMVRGDVVALRPGDQVSADGPVLVSDNLEVDESNLTGESDAVDKAVDDRVSSGTAVVAGTGWYRAEVVGPNATAQRLAAEAKVFTRAHSEVQHSTNVLLRWLTWIVLVMLPISAWSQWRAVRDQGWQEVVLRTAAGMVGLVPEGLVVLTTLAFLLAAVQLTRKQALVQELPAVELLARVDVICVDKTGTLTEGQIAFESLHVVDGESEKDVRQVLASLSHDPAGNQTSHALARAFPDPFQKVTERAAFSSARKWSGGVVAGQSWLLGAPDVLLPQDAEPGLLSRVQAASDSGRRVLLLARADSLPTGGEAVSGVQPAAVLELAELVRHDARETLDFFRDQGVRVVVISGDTPRTVAAVARDVGLDVMETVDARTLPDDESELAEIVERTTIFGRVTPTQKRAIVRALQSRGHVVAMTGDGVNDVLALKDADIGIAMGNGAQATKAVAQLVLLDSRFAHLPAVLAEGRRLIGNVERVASLFVTKNVMSAVSILAAAFLGLAYPFLPSQLTLVSTLTIGIPAAILALGPNHRRYQPGFLRRVLAISVPAGVVAGASAFVVYAVLSHGAVGAPVASTAALTSLLVTMLWLLGCLARPYRPWKVVVLATMAGLAALAYLLPQGRTFFAIAWDLGAFGWGLVAGAAGAAVVEVAFRVSRARVPTVDAGHHRPQARELPSTEARPYGTRPFTQPHAGRDEHHPRHGVPERRSTDDHRRSTDDH